MNKYVVWFMYFTLCIYCMLDVYHTMLLMTLGTDEANPLLQFLIDRFNPLVVLLSTKVIPLTGLGILLTRLP